MGIITDEARAAVAARFEKYVDRGYGDACWLWTGARDTGGYGTFGIGRRMVPAHRVAYELAIGPIPEGMCVCHVCDRRACCAPYHLFLGTHAENMRDMVAKGRAARGTANGRARCTAAQVEAIRTAYASGGWSQRGLAAQFGVGRSQICQIVRGECYRECAGPRTHAGKGHTPRSGERGPARPEARP